MSSGKKQRTVRQHFIPRFLLRSFAKNDQILRFDRQSGTKRLVGTGDAAVISDQYTIWDETGLPSDGLEGMFSELEAYAEPAIRRLVGGHTPTPVERRVVSRFLAYQRVRGPSWRREIEHILEFGATLPGFAEQNPLPGRRELFTLMIEMAEEEIAPRLYAMSWTVLVFDRPTFVLGDDPLVIFREAAQNDSSLAVGLDACDEISFPFGRYAMLLLDSHIRSGGHSVLRVPAEPPRSAQPFNILTGALLKRRKRLEDDLRDQFDARNGLALAWSHRYVFAHPDDQLLFSNFAAAGNRSYSSFSNYDGSQDETQASFSAAPDRIPPLRRYPGDPGYQP